MLPEHLVRLPGADSWALWRCVGVRSAGFPAAHVQALADRACAAAADRVRDAEEVLAAARDVLEDALTDVLNRRLDELERSDDPLRADLMAEARRLRQQAKRNLRGGRLPGPAATALVEQTTVAAFQAADAALGAERASYGRAFVAATARLSRAICDLARTDRLHEAILWQNRRVTHTVVRRLLSRAPDASISRQRQTEELIAQYVQRYCVKNDTIGFFGPLGWARLVDQGEALSARPGPGLLAARAVYFEQWCIDALAETVAQEGRLRPWLAPRRLPYVHIDGRTLYLMAKEPVTLSPGQAALLRACDGERTAKEIAVSLLRTHFTELKSESGVYKQLETFVTMGLIVWTLEVPFAPYPERNLRRRLERITDERLRRPALAALEELEAARDAVAAAAGDVEKLDQALGALEETFVRTTGRASTRAAGETYAARTLVYEDCRRDLEVDIGPAVVQELGPPLALLLESSRWYMFEASRSYRRLFQQIYEALAQQTGSRVVEMASFWLQVQPLLRDETELVRDLQRRFQERWERVLSISPRARRLVYTSEVLRSQVRQAFDAPWSGWSLARYHAPDVLIAASSVEEIRRGCYQFVMGELHAGTNTLRPNSFVAQHPAPEELLRATALDMGGPRVVPVTPRTWPGMTSRTRPDLVLPRDLRLAFSDEACGVPRLQALPIGELVIEDTDQGLIVRTRDGRLRFDIIECSADVLSFYVADGLKLLMPRAHTPRVAIDRLVICRETWRFSPEELPFAGELNPAERFLGARHWVRTHGLPRFVFASTPIECKPIYIDFESPVLLTIFARLVRRTMNSDEPEPLITLTEMLPALDQIWLPDAQGQRYTTELRIVALDLKETAANRQR